MSKSFRLVHFFSSLLFVVFFWTFIVGGESNAASHKNPSNAKATKSVEVSDKAETADGLVIKLKDGLLQGDLAGGSRRFVKIPYAKPPVGNLRWKAPVKNEPWKGIRYEKKMAEPCPQCSSPQVLLSTEEDCLYLNIWAPADLSIKKAPVMVWLHGGGNYSGAADDLLPGTRNLPAEERPLHYDGQFLAAKYGVVVVTLNYRLGVMGFFPHPELEDEGSPVGNQGLLDQVAVLKWVRDNIAKFGGDPGNVTLWGQSAGSVNVGLHILSPKSKGLFHRAIGQSAAGTTRLVGVAPITEIDYEPEMAAFAKKLGCDGRDALGCMRKKSTDEVLAAADWPNPLRGKLANFPFTTKVDGPGGFLPDHPVKLFEHGRIANKVPYILGTCNDEGSIYTLRGKPVNNEEEYLIELERRYTSRFAKRIAAQYPASKFNNSYKDALTRLVGDSSQVCSTEDFGRRSVKAGLPVYYFNFNIPWSVAPQLGAAHSSDISHSFNNPWKPKPSDLAVADAMGLYWTKFARTGDPNGPGAPIVWPRYLPDKDGNNKRLQIDPDWKIVDNFRKEECTFWRGIYGEIYGYKY